MTMNATDDVMRLPASETTLLCLYSVVLVVGMVSNASLALVLCAQQAIRNKNPLLLGLCLSDLLVCCLSAPLTISTSVSFATRPWSFVAPWCKLVPFLQALPVAVSTLSMMLMSVDRYVTVKYPRSVGRLRQRRNTVAATTVCVWLTGCLLTCPLLIVRRIQPRDGTQCVEVWTSAEWRGCFVFSRLFLVHVVPCATVFACHMGVHSKLSAFSLRARAARGELPLPMPLISRPVHVIILAGLPTNTDGKVKTYRSDGDSSLDANRLIRGAKTATNVDKKLDKRPSYSRYRASKTEQEIRKENQRLRPQTMDYGSGIDVSSKRSTSNMLRSRRKLANALVSVAIVFTGCWLPHVVCTACAELSAPSDAEHLHLLLQFSLLLGHAHSAINPVMYWVLNYQSLNNACLPISLLSQMRILNVYKNASSTNEAALGPFHPKYTRPNTPAVRQPSSLYLY